METEVRVPWYVACIYACIAASAAALQRSEEFSAVRSAGQTQCALDVPFIAERARSRIDCANLCLALNPAGVRLLFVTYFLYYLSFSLGRPTYF